MNPLHHPIRLSAAVVGLGVLGWLTYPSASYPQNGATEGWSIQVPEDKSLIDHQALSDSRRHGGPLPEGYAPGDWKGRIEWTEVSGPPRLFGERVWSIKVTDDVEDLVVAEVLRNGRVVQTATRANGGIVDQGDLAVASLEFRARSGLWPVTAEVTHSGPQGLQHSSSATFKP